MYSQFEVIYDGDAFNYPAPLSFLPTVESN